MSKILLVIGDNATPPTFGYRCKNGFETLGNDVDTFNYRYMQLHRFPITNHCLNEMLLKKASKDYDLVFVLKGEKLEKGVVREISQTTKIVNWSIDDPFGELNPFNTLNNLDEYDNFFVFDPYYVRKLKKSGIKAHYLPCAVDPEIHKEVIPIEKRKEKYDISFIGTYQKNRQEILSNLKEYTPDVWGYHWKPSKYYNLHGIFHGNKKKKDTVKMCRTFNESKINLNIHFPHSIESVNLRTFDIPATKSFQLSDYFKEIPNLFNKNEIATYKNLEDLKELIPYYLENKEERHKIALAGYKRVIKDHTFDNRMREVLKTTNIT